MKFTSKDLLLLFLSIVLGGFPMLQPTNPILGWSLVILGVIGVAWVLLRSILRAHAANKTERKTPQGLSFKNLDVNTLKIHAKRWLAKYPEALIEKIVLYRSSHLKYQAHFGPISAKYFVVFEVSEDSDSTHLEPATQYYQATEKDFLDLMASDFNEVYNRPPTSEIFKKEWEFYVLRPQEKLPSQVMKDEPSIVLHP